MGFSSRKLGPECQAWGLDLTLQAVKSMRPLSWRGQEVSCYTGEITLVSVRRGGWGEHSTSCVFTRPSQKQPGARASRHGPRLRPWGWQTCVYIWPLHLSSATLTLDKLLNYPRLSFPTGKSGSQQTALPNLDVSTQRRAWPGKHPTNSRYSSV